jgi:hypothetical protein
MRFISLLFLALYIPNSYAQVQEFLNPIELKVLNINIKNTEEENIKKTAMEIVANYKLNALKIDEPSSKQICDLTKKVNEWTDCKGSRENNTKTTKYIGEFKDGKHHGFGKEILTNGTQFLGYYENNQRIYGLLNLPSSTVFVTYAGPGKIEGNIIQLDNKNGNIYIGGFFNAQKNGKGLLIDVNGKTSIGNFINGVFVQSIKEINAVADALGIGNANAQTLTQQANTSPPNAEREIIQSKFEAERLKKEESERLKIKQDLEMLNQFINLFSGAGGGSAITNPQELAKIKQQNLAHRWFVRAEAVCSGGARCSVKSVQHIGNNENDGSAEFQISVERWVRSGGSSSTVFIRCGFNHSNTLRSTSVNAVCQ